MSFYKTVLITVAAALLSQLPAAAADGAKADGADESKDVTLLLQEAYYNEVALSDLKSATELYSRVRDAAGVSPEDSAAARVRRGVCYQGQGQLEKAESDFRAVVEESSSPKEAKRLAKRLLGVGSPRHPARFMPPNTVIYAELVDVAGQVGFLSDLLRGTPLEKPADYYLSQSSRGPLNLDFVKAFEKIDGFAVGVTSIEEDPPGVVGVLQPGASDLSRGLVKALMTLSVFDDAVDGMPIFRFQDNQQDDKATEAPKGKFFLSLDRDQTIVLFGSRRTLVRQAIRRYQSLASESPQKRIPSLADVADFRRSLSARSGSALFAYFHRGRLIEAIRRKASLANRAGFDIMSNLLGLDHLRSLSLTFSRSGASFRLALRARAGAEFRAPWEVLRTPVLDPQILRFIPREPLGFAAASIVDVRNRVRRVREAIKSHVPDFPDPNAQRFLKLLLPSEGTLASGQQAVADVLAKLRHFALVQPKLPQIGVAPSSYAVFGFADDANLDAAFERFLSTWLELFFQNRANREFRASGRRVTIFGTESEIRTVEPVPGFVAGYAQCRLDAGAGKNRRQFFVVALAASTIERLFAPDAKAPLGFPQGDVPAASRKILYLRPMDLVRAFKPLAGSRKPDEFEIVASKIPRLVFQTLETNERFSLKLTIPDAAQVLRDLLQFLQTRDAK